MFETRLGILVQTLIWETSKHGQRGGILLGGRELVRGLRGTRTFHLFHLFLQISLDLCLVWFCGRCFVVCLFLLAFAFGEICFLSSLIPVVDRQCLALVRQCRKKKSLICSVPSHLSNLCSCHTEVQLQKFHPGKPCQRSVDRPMPRARSAIATKKRFFIYFR